MERRRRPAFDQNHDELSDMLRSLSDDIAQAQNLVQRSAYHRRADLTRRIQEVNMEFTRIRANGMRESFEQRLAQQAEERRNRRRTDSDSSSSSDDSDLDLDSCYPLDSYQPCSSSTQTPTSSTQTAASQSVTSLVDTSSLMEIGETTISEKPSQAAQSSNASGCASSSSSTPSSSSNTEEAQAGATKRKTSTAMEEAPPAKRSMATSTEDAYFQKC